MGPSGQDAPDHPGAGASRTHFQEHAHPIGISRFDDCWEIHTFHSLGQDRVGGALAVYLVGLAPGAAIKAYPRQRSGWEEVQLSVRLGNLPCNLAMDRGYAVQGEETAAQLFDNFADF